jgi:glycosyltransferase involved in cell wall biosynthesis
MTSAIVHYWLVRRRGGELVLDAIADLMPRADLISHVVDPMLLRGPLANRTVRETFIHSLPFAKTRYPAYLPLMPLALEMMDMSAYDLIVSSEAGPAKWVIKDPDAWHICYCHSPLRYIWDQRDIYLQKIPALARPVAHAYASHLRHSDQLSAMRVDRFVANSSFVARRIASYYRRDAEVIHPPVDVGRFHIRSDVEDYYLFAGELRGYKGAALAIEACNRLNRKLYIVGGGVTPDLCRLAGPTITFLGRLSDENYDLTLSRCRALLFPGVEDFGIIPVEVMAAGRPVIARGKGGAMDSVVHGETGIHFDDPSVEGLVSAMREFEAVEDSISPTACVDQARKFSREVFKSKFSKILAER